MTVSLNFFFRCLPESPRWLISKGRIDDSKTILAHAAKVNQKTIPSHLLEPTSDLDKPEKEESNAKLWHILSHQTLLKRTLILMFNWYDFVYTIKSKIKFTHKCTC